MSNCNFPHYSSNRHNTTLYHTNKTQTTDYGCDRLVRLAYYGYYLWIFLSFLLHWIRKNPHFGTPVPWRPATYVPPPPPPSTPLWLIYWLISSSTSTPFISWSVRWLMFDFYLFMFGLYFYFNDFQLYACLMVCIDHIRPTDFIILIIYFVWTPLLICDLIVLELH